MTDAPLSSRPWLRSYAEGVPADIEEPTQTLPEMLAAGIRQYARRPALEFFGAVTSYRDLGEQIDRAAEGLRHLGVTKGDRVALVLPNCPQHVVAFYAVLRLGAIVVEHNPLYTARELRHQFEDHGARVAIVWDKVADTVAGFPDDLRVDHIVSVDLTAAMPLSKRLLLRLPVPKARASRAKLTGTPRARHLTPWKKLVSHRRLPRRTPAPSLGDTAVLQYTSGTTGIPKGAILTHANLRANAMQGRAWVPGLRDGEETFYAVLPLFHAYGLTLCLTFALSIGAKVVLFPTFDLGLVTDAARTSPPTFLPAVPPIYDQLARAAGRGTVDLSSVRFAISGAMSLPVETVRRWEEATGGLLVEGYGMTEASPVALGNPMGPTRRPGTVGVPFPSTEIRIVDPDDPDADVPTGEPGELLLRGPQVFQGYWGRPGETAEALLPDGWLRTGDIAEVSPDGFVTIVDRRKELIITGGFNVAPSEVENALEAHPDVVAAAVVGLPRSSGGEEVAAAVVLREGAAEDMEGLRDFCRTRLTAYKVPRRITAVDDLPRSLIGKVLRREVRDRLLAARGA
ncbi:MULTISPECIES: long-chain-fatty-acid--CoA ligase [Actinomycetes]|uniref:long-chain-fatty-acid--CoA ligase n=1 Tax=Actinomycetes TaxID=1760 RepID=UPI0024686724|nr:MULTISPECIES: long-chain-fatty-acid--CoA ligase [unclassified Microbacterium]MDH5133792.1 long-chain-fatty-acid--CoA ligase [Microbacterium sp. RD10]MDH5137548.1 long-chain-fatty-acid--CoA ligase [Microbacterium sp. RD11]MDH5144777.1 long-chain-fatty-acid--CoA ligase [Microbacterium sp. RD12]MDH5155634.1 long-chain-fatty-acid--CoA ligase [Microbacterium sp. RD06]MDH5166934.1 long-chain-fatty-acid--CoA ligase [Microbacterium sp. RD02]